LNSFSILPRMLAWPHVETEVQVQVRGFQKHQQPFGAGQIVGNILEQNFNAALFGEQADLFQRENAASSLRTSYSSQATPRCWIR
jgi:hypothetical protein